jgi:nitroimidazol reductase NimA-like FMN-containing flavoprotein (pyridoxamine 5'-phosphate oxidase superfamily)
MPDREEMKRALRELFAAQKLAVLATRDEHGHPYTSLMAFAATENLDRLLLATERSSRKFANLTAEPRVALLIDSRSNRDSDLQEALAVTVMGRAEEVDPEEGEGLLQLYVAKHPRLEAFVTSPTCALIHVQVEVYYVASQFQRVTELRPGD